MRPSKATSTRAPTFTPVSATVGADGSIWVWASVSNRAGSPNSADSVVLSSFTRTRGFDGINQPSCPTISTSVPGMRHTPGPVGSSGPHVDGAAPDKDGAGEEALPT